MQKNDYVITKIVSLSSEGYGIGKNDEYILFVPHTCIGDLVKVKILKIKKNTAFCKITEYIEKSPHHITPLCDSYKMCGGCSLLHIDYEKQLEYKKNKVEEAIKRIGKLNLKVHEVHPSSQFNYRNKVLIPVGEDKDGNIIHGFFRRKSHDIINTKGCVVQDNDSVIICNLVTEWMKSYNIKPYNFETGKGIVRHIYIRKAFSTGNIMTGIVATKENISHIEKLIESLKEIKGVSSVILNINSEKTNVILGNKTKILWGDEYLKDKISDKEFCIGSMSFYQINREQTENLYKKAGELLELFENDVLYDIYCGIGTIGICIGSNVKKIIGAEIIPEAVELAKKNAALNGIDNAEYFVGKAEEMTFSDSEKPTAVVIDPPRKGCDINLINTLLELKPQKICYISCDCATLARDLKIFSDSGLYTVGDVYPFDMFPNTEHVECVVRLCRNEHSVI